ncbi:MAG: UDP-N-acetylmuramoyl-L-alanyl-D-glutamate--2,6-diaminopimelate ligase [Paenibacillaceae bacterium]|nr:UDP-N-acetylmuramoyl-L-alanyl-D-glutamate--2,6-diaminopimelate ligase [Paenibacillaceae bacterium]
MRDVVQLLPYARVYGDVEVEVRGIAVHSQHICAGDLFCCVRGVRGDGEAYVVDALARGAVAVIASRIVTTDVPVIVVRDVRRAAAAVAAALAGHPSKQMRIAAVTGTNGKTTTTAMIDHIWQALHIPSGLIGTVVTRYGDVCTHASLTTPDVCSLQRTLCAMRDAGVQRVAMEVSSHALDQGRIIGVDVDVAVLTNITHDHLDYHKTMEAYVRAKTLLFSRLGNVHGRVAVINADDAYAQQCIDATAASVVTYGIASEADVRATHIVCTLDETTCVVRTHEQSALLRLPAVGSFQVANALAALCVVMTEGVPLHRACAALASFAPMRGRMERVRAATHCTVFVDYAHTPDGLRAVLGELRLLKRGRLITVFGCGGERDTEKRPLMGAISAAHSDMTVVTSDNPRSERPEDIASDIVSGIAEDHEVHVVLDRARAIAFALDVATEDDVVLVAGKGHETVQTIGSEHIPCDDAHIVAAWVAAR